MKIAFISKYKEYSDKNFNLAEVMSNPIGKKLSTIFARVIKNCKTLNYDFDSFTFNEVENHNLDDYDIIFMTWVQVFGLVFPCKMAKSCKMILRNKNKIVRVDNDPSFYRILEGEAAIPIEKYNRKMNNNFNKSRFVGCTPENIADLEQLMRFMELECPVLIGTYFNHTDEDKKKCYGDGYKRIFLTQSHYDFAKVNVDEIPFEERSAEINICSSIKNRMPNRTFMKQYGIVDPVENIGLFGDRLKDKETGKIMLSENQVQESYAKKRYVLAPSPHEKALSWMRPRFIYSAYHKCIILGSDPELQFYDDSYRLDKSLFEMPIEKQKEIAEAQASFFFKNLVPEEESLENFKKMISTNFNRY